MTIVRIPKPSYLVSQLALRKRPDIALGQVLGHLAELYQLGEIQIISGAPESKSLNVFVTTTKGKFVIRRHSLSEETVAHEHQVLSYLQQRDFPAPRMLTSQTGQAWINVDGALYSVYDFEEGYCASDFIWKPAVKRDIIKQAGRTLAEYHQAITGLVPSFYKWDGYRPHEHRRWREGDLYRKALTEIRMLLYKPGASNPVDSFTRAHLADIEQMIELESIVENRSDLSKLVIHGDFSPWNIRFRRSQTPFVLDFNAARLDLKIFDVVLATFFFAWRRNRLDLDRAMAFQAGYCQGGQLREADLELAGKVFRWVMGRTLAERLRTHYLEQRFLLDNAVSLERFYAMCVFAEKQPQRLVSNLKGIIE